ncbi:hypothetical protein B0I35DRAFT_72468 [Stachybotrys elegans]|uniref:Uncharacterized protein n=1 Tax=Stachybotrys elegans TaxID=80388 RepID=A0A8K0WN50_9HYPO|nr:hypothetical protein B0I35DRAFT_72468 [Stachybotrys elegans]
MLLFLSMIHEHRSPPGATETRRTCVNGCSKFGRSGAPREPVPAKVRTEPMQSGRQPLRLFTTFTFRAWSTTSECPHSSPHVTSRRGKAAALSRPQTRYSGQARTRLVQATKRTTLHRSFSVHNSLRRVAICLSITQRR